MVSGSLRSGSVNSAVLRTAAAMAPAALPTNLFLGMANLPPYNPDDDVVPGHAAVADLRAAVGGSGGILFCTPEYAGSLPGVSKNLLDWLVGGVETTDKPTAWINASSPAAPAGGEDAHAALRRALGYLGARIVERACIRLPLSRAAVSSDGLLRERTHRRLVLASLEALADAASGPATLRDGSNAS